MTTRSVHPQHACPSATPLADWFAVYTINVSNELPLINVTRSVRSVCLRGGVEQAYVRFMNRYKAPLFAAYAVGLVAYWVVLVVPARTGRVIACVASAFTVIMSTVYALVLRYEVVCLVVRTYEFWFFSASNVVSAVLLAIHLNDVRAAMVVGLCLTLQNNIMTDANTVFVKGYFTTAIAVLLFLVYLIIMIMFELIDGVREIDLLCLDANRRLTVQDALLHGYSTQAIMLARNIYRRWTTTTRPSRTQPTARTIACVTLRARVKLHRVEAHPVVNPPRMDSIVPQPHGPALVRLTLVPVNAVFLADEVLISSVRSVVFTTSVFQRNAIRRALLTIAYIGLLFAAIVVIVPHGSYSNVMAVVSFVCSAMFIGLLWTTSQRQLLRRLVFTFDFAFLSGQLVVVHACVCDMLGWGYASLPVVTLWLWIVWVLMTDAVTPVVKHKWGIRRRLPAIVMLIFIVSQILIFAIVVSETSSRLRNRVIVSLVVRGHVLQMKVIPMLLSRLVILFGWSWKILWRMWTIHDDELLMIQGSMTYVNLRRQSTIPVVSTKLER